MYSPCLQPNNVVMVNQSAKYGHVILYIYWMVVFLKNSPIQHDRLHSQVGFGLICSLFLNNDGLYFTKALFSSECNALADLEGA